MTDLAVIGGSGFDQLPGLVVRQQKSVSTPYGEPSAMLGIGEFRGLELVFLPRHGAAHSLPPHKINYRANLYALKHLGVREVIGLAAVGGITPEHAPGSIAVPAQVIDYTWGRKHTYYDGENIQNEYASGQSMHIDFSRPYNEYLRSRLIRAAEKSAIDYQPHGVYAVTQGPRLETAAEIDRLEMDGADLVGMTTMPEAALAKELDLPYACVALVVNAAAGRGGGDLTMGTMYAHLAVATDKVQSLLQRFE